MSSSTQSYIESLLILRSSLIYFLLCKTSELMGLVKTAFKSVLNVGLYLPRVVGAYNIYTDVFPWKFIQNYHLFYLTLYIDIYLWFTSLLCGVMFLHHDLYRVYTIIGDLSPLSNPV